MTAEEAIKKMNILSSKLGVILSDMPDLVQTVNDALEKQIPKKPYEETIATEEEYMTKKRSFFYCCPNCFFHLNEGQKHCDDCGQALDWSDTE